MYSPLIGQFAQRDPLGYAAGDANLLRYVGNSTASSTDPNGLQGVGAVRYKQLTWDDDFQPSMKLGRYDASVRVGVSVLGKSAPETIDAIQFAEDHEDREFDTAPEAIKAAKKYIHDSLHIMPANGKPAPLKIDDFVLGKGTQPRCSFRVFKFDPDSVGSHAYAYLDRNNSFMAEWLASRWKDRTNLQANLTAIRGTVTGLENQLVDLASQFKRSATREQLLAYDGIPAARTLQIQIGQQKADLAFLQNFNAGMSRLLNHEQRHFDIAELYARAFAAELKSLRVVVLYGGPLQDAFDESAQRKLSSYAASRVGYFEKSQQQLNKQYDDNVAHGLILNGPVGQQAWDNWIAGRLNRELNDDPTVLGLDRPPSAN